MAIGAVSTPSKTWVPPVGMIITTGSSTSPAALYDGTSWTQIKDRFLIGAGGSYALGSTGGSATHTMSAAEMPAHSHSGSITAVGNHNHTIHDAGGTSIYNILKYPGNEKIYTTVTVSFGTAGAHTHSVSIGSNGSGKAFDIMNPYVAKYMWRRVS